MRKSIVRCGILLLKFGGDYVCRPTHRLDEFPAGYSSAGWSPPEPASDSPAGLELSHLAMSSGLYRTAEPNQNSSDNTP